MNNYNKINAINSDLENELKKQQSCYNITKSAIQSNKQQQDQTPTPEPRRRLLQTNQPSSPSENRLKNEIAMDDQKVAKLVKVRYHHIHVEDDNDGNDTIYRKEDRSPQQDRINEPSKLHASFDEGPVEVTIDERNDGTTNVDYDDVEDEEIGEEYYDDDDDEEEEEEEEDYVNTDTTGELANLSKQSMVPLNELIAYYQYIQQGNAQVDKGNSISRQSSSASQQTARARYPHRQDNDTAINDDRGTRKQSTENCDDLDGAIHKVEGQISRVQIHNIHLESCSESGSEKTTDHKDETSHTIPTQPKPDKRRIRSNVILELINSERDFVKHLKDVVEGYLYPARRHPEIFTGERINTIFANIEQLYEFQQQFLNSLESHINWDDPAKSEVGKCFLEYEKGFSVYHHYCNNHPNATSELQDLYTKPRFVKFFEACRLLQNMIDISLDGFLLTPIQKICKYPLQLTELLKNTDEAHPDYQHVADALESMRNCANLANERKRRIEALADVMSFQEKVENWFGPKLSDSSSVLIHSGEVYKMNSHTWLQNVQLYLFDHLLLYSKKDLLKRNSLILKGRINMDTVTEISDADEYKPKKSFKLYCGEQQKWFVFVTKSEKEKDEWIRAFERERNLVETDENEGFQITEREIGVARRALQNRKHSRSARYRHKRPDTAIVDQLDLDDANMIMNRTLSLPSCIHPSHVMNFVEDSKVVSTRKKQNTSPSSSSRSPMAGSQQFAQDQDLGNNNNTSSVGGNWFKKMGSKKLSRSQVYNINGQTGHQPTNTSSKSPSAASPSSGGVNLANAVSIVTNDAAAIKYDQLEKRHRDHMVSEEQARLFRLNNDLPQPSSIFNRSNTTTNPFVKSSSVRAPAHSVANPLSHRNEIVTTITNPTGQHSLRGPPLGTTTGLVNQSHSNNSSSPDNLNFQSLSIDSPQRARDRSPRNRESSTFEATVMLSSGRMIKVREDAV